MGLLRGTAFGQTAVGAGAGFAVSDPIRLDLTRPVPAYVYIDLAGQVGPTPAAPYFYSVTASNGVITAVLRCIEAVDGYELSWSTTNVHNTANLQYNSGGTFVLSSETPYYLFGRSVRGQLRSEWTPYGTSPPGYSLWETVWNDSFSHYTVDTTYPGLQHIFGTGGDYVYVLFASPNRVCCYDYHYPQSLSIFGTATGVRGSYWGARHQFKAYFNWYGGDENGEELGVVFGARVAILTSYLTETYYVLAGRRKNATELYFRLYSVTGSTFTQLDISGNVHSYFPLLTTPYDIQITRTGDDFYVHKISTGEEVWHTTDDSIPPATTRIYTGVWMTGPLPLVSGGRPYIWDYWKIYRMVSGLDPAVVDPGHPYDGLQPTQIFSAGLASEFALSENVVQEAGNDAGDFTHFRLGDSPDRQPLVKAKAYDPETGTWTDTDERALALLANAYAWGTVRVSGEDDVVADAPGDVLTLIAGSGIAITTDESSDTVTIEATGGTCEWDRDGSAGELYPATDGDAVSLRDSAVAHGMTALGSTDSFLRQVILDAAHGGADLIGMSDDDASGLRLRGVIGYTDPTDTTPAVVIYGAKVETSVDAYTKLLLHCNGVDGSDTFTDDSPGGLTVARTGNTHIETDQAVFGTASVYFDGNHDNLYVSSSDFDFGTGDFTVDFWMRDDGTTNKWPKVIGNSVDGWVSNNTGITSDHSGTPGKIAVWCYGFSTSTAMLVSTTTVNAGTWYHVAWVRSGNTHKLFVNGVCEDTETHAGAINLNEGALGLMLGESYNVSSTDTCYKGYLDEIRLSKGIARWTADFSVPTSEYGSGTSDGALDDEETVLSVRNYWTEVLRVRGDGRVIAGSYILIDDSEADPEYLGNLGDNLVIAADQDQDSKGIPKISLFLGSKGVVAQYEWTNDGSRFGYNVAAGSTLGLYHLQGVEDIPALILQGKSSQTADLAQILDSTGAELITVGADGAVTVGTDGAGADVLAYGATAGRSLGWDASKDMVNLAGLYRQALEDDANVGATLLARIDATAPLIADYSGETGTDYTLATVYVAVKFVPATDISAGGFSIWAKNDGTYTNMTDTLTGYIYSHDSGTGTPSGTSLGTATAIKYGGLTSSYAEHQFYLSTLVALTAGTTYWLVFKRSAAPAGANLLIDSDAEADYGATSATGAASSWTLTTSKLRSTVYARSPIAFTASSDSNVALRGYGYAGIGVYGWSRTSEGVYGTSQHGYGGRFVSTSNYGIWGQSTYGIAVYAYNPGSGYGLNAQSLEGSPGYYTQSGTVNAPKTITAAVLGVRKMTAGTCTNNGNLIYVLDAPAATVTAGGYILTVVVGTSSSSTERIRFDPRVVDGGSAVAYFFDTMNALSTSGAKLASWRNQGTEKLSIAHDGVITPGGYNAADGTAGATASVAVAKVGGGTRTLSFKNGLYTGYTDS